MSETLTLPRPRDILERIKNLMLRPSDEWARIAHEPANRQGLFLGHVAPLAAAFVLAPKIGQIIAPARINGQSLTPNVAGLLLEAVVGFACVIGAVWAVAYLIDRMAEQFSGKRDFDQALKLSAYSGTGVWLAGIIQIIPMLDLLAVAGVGAVYTLYKGAPILMKTPTDRALPFTAAITVSAAVIAIVLMSFSSCVQGAGRVPSADLQPSAATSSASQAAKDAAAAIKQTAPPQKRDPAAPLPMDKLTRLLPESIPGGWVRAELSVNAGGFMGFTGPTAMARYEKGAANLRLHIVDLGPNGAGRAIAAVTNLSKPFESATAYRRMSAPGLPFALAEADSVTGAAAGLSVVENRVAVAADGVGVTGAELQVALNLIDLQRVSQIAQGF
jgi:hypothetical protein